MKNLKLDRPLAVFDLETTGVNPDKDRIVQMAIIRIEPDGRRTTFETLVNPEMPIPAGASAVHGIKDEDVRDKPTFSQIRREVEEYLQDAVLGGFNSINFDTPLLMAELRRAEADLDLRNVKQLDAMRIFHKMERRDLTAAYRFYCDEELVGAHSALADTEATLAILDAQIGRYEEVPNEVEELHRFCNPDEGKFVDRQRKFIWNDDNEAEFSFGKYQGKPLQDVCKDQRGRGYLEWMLGKDFNEEIKDILRSALDGVFPKRQ
ncbi:MAG: 3'-5' exonuclease [bacterium]|nr:3'-5' exonuclease [bacterium]